MLLLYTHFTMKFSAASPCSAVLLLGNDEAQKVKWIYNLLISCVAAF